MCWVYTYLTTNIQHTQKGNCTTLPRGHSPFSNSEHKNQATPLVSSFSTLFCTITHSCNSTKCYITEHEFHCDMSIFKGSKPYSCFLLDTPKMLCLPFVVPVNLALPDQGFMNKLYEVHFHQAGLLKALQTPPFPPGSKFLPSQLSPFCYGPCSSPPIFQILLSSKKRLSNKEGFNFSSPWPTGLPSVR